MATRVAEARTSSATMQLFRVCSCAPYFLLIVCIQPATMEMTPAVLKELCRKNGGYGTAYLNDKLYAHYKGFRRIENLEAYTGLRVIWLEGNGLAKIEGLSAQTDLMTLYLQENIIDKIENLEANVREECRVSHELTQQRVSSTMICLNPNVL